ncbi:hypothetical protein ACQPZX_24030 [Actinoplanes sp. CA-142083]|uniref:hypothetical protein n=1 Tax=Actinoplanes sp. CA-142083 TaxID=3239903 RepID=UPI003D92F71E
MVERVQVLLALRCARPSAQGPEPGQRSMAALAVAYVVILSTMVSAFGATSALYVALLAAPQLARRRTTFTAASGLVAALVLAAAPLGGLAFWPAVLPLLLALIPIPERWSWFLTPIALAFVTALLGLAAYAFSLPTRTW